MKTRSLFVTLGLISSLTISNLEVNAHCYDALANLQYGYRIEDTKTTDFLAPIFNLISDDTTTCLTLSTIDGEYCNFDEHNRLSIPRALYGLHEVIITSYSKRSRSGKRLVQYNNSFQYYIESIPTRPLVPSRVNITFPKQGCLVEEKLQMLFELDSIAVSHGLRSVINVHSVVDRLELDSSTNIMNADFVEPASWFLSMSSEFPVVVSNTDTGVEERVVAAGYPAFMYTEYILSPSVMQEHRVHSSRWKEGHSHSSSEGSQQTTCSDTRYISETCSSFKHLRHPSLRPSAPLGRRPLLQLSTSKAASESTHVCVWGSNKLDGQKSIWIQQAEHLDKDRFRFTWILTTDVDNTGYGTVFHRLADINAKYASARGSARGSDPAVRVVKSPFIGRSIQLTELEEDPGDGSPPASALWKDGKDNFVYEYAAERLRLANYDVSAMTPRWARDLFKIMFDFMRSSTCSLMVYGNDRGFNSDILIRDTAFGLGIPTVTELLNLFLEARMAPDVVVGPSAYAVQHDSIVKVERALGEDSPRVVIIPPSVDTQKFNRQLVGNPIIPHKDLLACRRASVGHQNCIHVGFMARLSSEKNAGLFLMAAHKILQTNPFVRFTLIGDGSLRGQLERLTEMLDITWAVHFMGWVETLLPRVLAGFDIVVNPSVRGWSETFCIANIEAMSMEIPLVTFAVGGVGEYVDVPVVTGTNSSFSLSSNAVVVNVASPEALSEAVLHLAKDAGLRARLGQAGRATVLKYFTLERQMDQYAVLYEETAAMPSKLRRKVNKEL